MGGCHSQIDHDNKIDFAHVCSLTTAVKGKRPRSRDLSGGHPEANSLYCNCVKLWNSKTLEMMQKLFEGFLKSTLEVETLPLGWRAAWWRRARGAGLAAAGLERVFFLQ